MCGHGTIGTVTVLLEEGLVTPKREGHLRLEVPAGIVEAEYTRDNLGHVIEVRIRQRAVLPPFDRPVGRRAGFRPARLRRRLWRQFLRHHRAAGDLSRSRRASPPSTSSACRRSSANLVNEKYTFVHPENPTITGIRHVLWAGKPHHPEAARPQRRLLRREGHRPLALRHRHLGAHRPARRPRRLAVGDDFVHELIIGSLFRGRVEKATTVGDYDAIVPSVAGQAWITGHNTIFLDDRDPFVKGFSVL